MARLNRPEFVEYLGSNGSNILRAADMVIAKAIDPAYTLREFYQDARDLSNDCIPDHVKDTFDFTYTTCGTLVLYAKGDLEFLD